MEKTPQDINNIIKCQSLIRGWLVRLKQGLTSHQLMLIEFHKNFQHPKSQLDYYNENNASKEIIQYISLPGKTFGEKYMEQIAKAYFKLDSRTSSTHDHTKLGKTIEQKSARYHSNGDDWKWQHIEISHEWQYLLLCGVDFRCIRFYIGKRATVEELISDGIITGQGKKLNGIAQPQQAYWFSRSDFLKHKKKFTDYFFEIKSERSLIRYLQTN
uniref:Uncharacterized protein n=1 Tax=viral metagenome TaxID=1070528 RepID=A0A6C0AU90_9ZZZZ|tara:strand:+ start:7829 stop:8470 length:642 start_codon:yes stop_codon:yes gene_type:complete